MAKRPAANTTPSRGGKSEARLPHEHDESSDSAASPPRESMKQAHADLAAGRVDTDRGAAADAAYRQQKRPGGEQPPNDAGAAPTAEPKTR